MKRVGIIGLGSIGRRHARCLDTHGVEPVALRSGHGAALDDDHRFVREVHAIDDLLAVEPMAIIIANPTSMHADSALAYLERGLPVLIEKPVDADPASAAPLEPHAERVVVAYCMRFHRLYRGLRELVDAGRIGEPVKATFERGYYLPYWHPHADYRTEYAARRALGGGVVRTLSHELDFAQTLFGPFEAVAGTAKRVSELELDVEDFAHFSARSSRGVHVGFSLDFLAPTNVYRGEITGTAGALRFDLARDEIRLQTYDSIDLLCYHSGPDWDRMYVEQMEDFLRFVDTGVTKNCRLEQAIDSLRVIAALERCEETPT